MEKVYKKALLFLNTMSGVGNGRKDLVTIVESLSKDKYEVTVYPINSDIDFDMGEVLRDRAKEFDLVVCYGGDGSLNHLVNNMIKNNIDKPIGYISGGSTNDFSKNFVTSNSIEDKCHIVANGKKFIYDVGLFNDETYFNYVAAFGAFTKTSYTTSREIKKILGYGAYALTALADIPESFSYRLHMKITHDHGKEEGTYIYGCISNSLSVGGMQLPFYKESSLDDGLFEVLLIKAPDNVAEVVTILNDLASGHVDDEYVKSFKTSKIDIEAEESIMWTLDGEYGGECKNTHIEVIPKKVEIMVEK